MGVRERGAIESRERKKRRGRGKERNRVTIFAVLKSTDDNQLDEAPNLIS